MKAAQKRTRMETLAIGRVVEGLWALRRRLFP